MQSVSASGAVKTSKVRQTHMFPDTAHDFYGLQVTSVIVSRDGGREGEAAAMEASSASLMGRATFSLLTFDL